MLKKPYFLCLIAALVILLFSGCSALMGADGVDGVNGADGVNTGILGTSIYLMDVDTYEKFYLGDVIYLSYSLYGVSPEIPMKDLQLINNSWTSLTLSGDPVVEDLGGWDTVSEAYGVVPTITTTVPAAGIVDFATPVDLSLAFMPFELPQDSRFRKRYRIALQDAAGTHFSFDFEVEASISC